jgi:hypothetical protein
MKAARHSGGNRRKSMSLERNVYRIPAAMTRRSNRIEDRLLHVAVLAVALVTALLAVAG